jgi:hypothetical protein
MIFARAYFVNVSQVGCGDGRTIWIAEAHRDDGKRFVVHADDKLTAFIELESAIRGVSGEALHKN